MGIGTNSTSNPAYTPRGAIHVQAAQIEHEIDELKTVLKVISIQKTLFSIKSLFDYINFDL